MLTRLLVLKIQIGVGPVCKGEEKLVKYTYITSLQFFFFLVLFHLF